MRHQAAFLDNTYSIQYNMTDLPDVGAHCVTLTDIVPPVNARQLLPKTRVPDRVADEKVPLGTVVADPIVK